MLKKYAVVQTTTLPNNEGNNWLVPYPNGFTVSNCVILEKMVYLDGVWMLDCDLANRSCGLKTTGVGGYQNANYKYPSVLYKVVIMRTDI